jgi:predicted DNA-binding transcriptional regulator AlpA
MSKGQGSISLDLPRYVGVTQVCRALGYSKSALDRLRREGKFPAHEQLSPNRVGWRVDVIEAHLTKQAGAVMQLSVSNPDQIDPEELENNARELAAKALSRRTGQLVNPADVTLHLGQQVGAEEFVALEMAEHRIRAEGMARLSEIDAAVVAAVILPSLGRGLTTASPELARMLRSSDGLEIQFELVSDALRLFELSTRLCRRGARVPAGETVVEHLAGFETGRAMLVAAQLFPSLRELIIAESEYGNDVAIFADDALFQQAVTAALDDTAWPEFQAKIAQGQSATTLRQPTKMPA